MKFDRFRREQNRHHFAREATQRLLRCLFEQFLDVALDNSLAQLGDDACKQLFLVLEVAVHRHLRRGRSGGDRIHGRAAEAALRNIAFAARRMARRLAFARWARRECEAINRDFSKSALLVGNDTMRYRNLAKRR